MGKSWNDPAYSESILKKGQRRPRAARADEAVSMTEPLKCTNCNLPVNVSYAKHCRCSIWEIGKLPA